jgi:hypothetical protein
MTDIPAMVITAIEVVTVGVFASIAIPALARALDRSWVWLYTSIDLDPTYRAKERETRLAEAAGSLRDPPVAGHIAADLGMILLLGTLVGVPGDLGHALKRRARQVEGFRNWYVFEYSDEEERQLAIVAETEFGVRRVVAGLGPTWTGLRCLPNGVATVSMTPGNPPIAIPEQSRYQVIPIRVVVQPLTIRGPNLPDASHSGPPNQLHSPVMSEH